MPLSWASKSTSPYRGKRKTEFSWCNTYVDFSSLLSCYWVVNELGNSSQTEAQSCCSQYKHSPSHSLSLWSALLVCHRFENKWWPLYVCCIAVIAPAGRLSKSSVPPEPFPSMYTNHLRQTIVTSCTVQISRPQSSLYYCSLGGVLCNSVSMHHQRSPSLCMGKHLLLTQMHVESKCFELCGPLWMFERTGRPLLR